METLIVLALFGLAIWWFVKKNVTPKGQGQGQGWADDAPRLAPPPRRTSARFTGADDEPPSKYSGEGPKVPLNQSLYLEYTDANGSGSERRITTRHLRKWRNNEFGLLAWCHEREALRTFLSSRIKTLADCETGEVYHPPGDWLQARYAESPHAAPLSKDLSTERERQQKLNIGHAALLVLVYVAKADGRMNAAERGAIKRFLLLLQSAHQIDLMPEEAMDDRIKRMRCDHEQFLNAVEITRKQSPAFVAAFLKAAEDVMNADGRQQSDEQAALSWIRRAVPSQ